MIEFIFDAIYGLKGDFCLMVFVLGALLMGIGSAAPRRPVDSDEDTP